MARMTLNEIAKVPANEYISVEEYNQQDFSMRCAFCGSKLIRHTNGGIGRDKMVWYSECHCAEYQAATKHNALVR